MGYSYEGCGSDGSSYESCRTSANWPETFRSFLADLLWPLWRIIRLGFLFEEEVCENCPTSNADVTTQSAMTMLVDAVMSEVKKIYRLQSLDDTTQHAASCGLKSKRCEDTTTSSAG